jgi:hypothetical protein
LSIIALLNFTNNNKTLTESRNTARNILPFEFVHFVLKNDLSFLFLLRALQSATLSMVQPVTALAPLQVQLEHFFSSLMGTGNFNQR